jgi:hypothetical protein
MTTAEKEALMAEVAREDTLGKTYVLPIHLQLPSALIIVAHMQLALRHPAVKGMKAGEMSQDLIDQIVARIRADGYKAHAQLMELGNDPRHDRH